MERRLDNLRLRRGLVGMVDLEQYDYEPGAEAQVRATEGTVMARIPPRVAVRKNAPLELPHVMLLADDPEKTVLEPLSARKDQMEKVYDFDLMERGGHIAGWRLDGESMALVAAALRKLADPAAFRARYGVEDKPVLLFAVGDGNHSLATAKECYERQKKLTPREQWDSLPARYALVRAGQPPRRLPWSSSPSTGWSSAWSRSGWWRSCSPPSQAHTGGRGTAMCSASPMPGGRARSLCPARRPSWRWAPSSPSWTPT